MSKELGYLKYNPSHIYDVHISKIEIGSDNLDCDREVVEKIKESICEENSINPIILIASADNRYYLAIGKNQLRACDELNIKKVPCRIVNGDVEDIEILKIMFSENVTPLRRAIAMQFYINKYNMSRKDLSKIVELKENSISEILSLNRLPEEIKKVVINNKYFSLHALREIVRIRNPINQLIKFNKIKAKVDKRYSKNSSRSSSPDAQNKVTLDLSLTAFDKKFDNDTIKGYFEKITSEIKKIRTMYGKFELKKLRHEIDELNEELKALRYKISDSISIDE